LPAIMFLYASYWAITIRRALVSRIYRRQALWLGVLAVFLALNVFLTYSTNPVINVFIDVSVALLFAVMFAYVDSAVPVLRRSDPLLRGILRWGTLRYILWLDWALLAAFNVLPGLFPSLNSGTVGFIIEDAGWFTVATVLFGVSGVALVIGVRRSGDIVLRSSLKWLGAALFLAIMLFVYDTAEYVVVPSMTSFQFYYSYTNLPIGTILIVMSYFFYRSARALAPVGKIHDGLGTVSAS